MRRWLLALVAILAFAGLIWVLRDFSRPYRGYSGNLILDIEPGTQTPEVAELLVSRGVLAHRLPFLLLYGLGRLRHRSIKAGEYLFDRPLRPLDVHRKLVQGNVYFHLVVIPEGSDRFDIARILDQQLSLSPEEFLRVTQQGAIIRDLDPGASTVEGYLFPDTYRFPRDVSSAVVAETMLARFRQVFEAKFRQELGQPQTSLHEVITLAALVEKESPEPAERRLIAGVFARRLEKGIPLQCDPTVVYAARLNQRLNGGLSESMSGILIGRSTRPISQNDLDLDSPYNTYRYAGLPPGPICSPGEASIRAALNPAAGDTLYFVSNNHRGHVFARTLEEHQRNVARYRKEVAALHHVALKGGELPEQPSSPSGRGSIGAKKRSIKGAKPKKQKTAHPGVLPNATSGTGGGAGDSGHRG